MIRIVVSVFDSAVQTFGQPFFVAAPGAAIRSFTDEVNRQAPDNTLFMHPTDFELYQLGTFDDAEGSFTSEGRRLLARGKDVRLSEE